MKKIFSMLAVVLGMCALTACSGSGPSSVVEKAYDAMQAKDYMAVVDCLNQEEGVTDEEREQFAQLLESKAESSMNKKRGDMVGYEIISEEIAEDGQSAVVTVKATYADGSSSTDTNKVVKNANGDWKLSFDK